jgi:phosphoglycerate dehydrogenase-like enzyme
VERLTVLRCSHYPAEACDLLKAALPEHDVVCCLEEDVLAQVTGADVIVPARFAITPSVLAAAARCRLVHQLGAGVDHVDLPAAAERGIPVANVPASASGMAESVAEIAVFHIVGLLRGYPFLAAAVRRADWHSAPLSRSVWDCTVGIVGLGAIGQAIARLLRPYGCRVLGLKRQPSEDVRLALGLDWLGALADLPHFLQQADVVVLSVPLKPETRGLIGAAELGMMRRGSYLVNVARGAIVDEAALTAALSSGHLAGAGLDVFWDEPADPAHPVFQHAVMVTPHVAGHSISVLRRSSAVVADNVRRLLAGEPIQYRVN